MSDDQAQSLATSIDGLAKRYGPGVVMTRVTIPSPVQVLATGFEALDGALGISGWPKGRVIEIAGPDRSGKTRLLLHAIAKAQAQGETAAFVDVDHHFDPEVATALGVDLAKLLVAQPDNGEQALEITETLVRSGAVGLVAIDSVANLVPQAEIEGVMGADPGLQARLMSQSLRKITSVAARTGTVVLFANPTRIRRSAAFGGDTVETFGGNALKFYASVRVRTQVLGGGRVSIKVVKNKLAPPFTSCEVQLLPVPPEDSKADAPMPADRVKMLQDFEQLLRELPIS